VRERERIVPDVETLGDDLVLLSVNPGSGRITTMQKIGYGLMGAELVRLAASGRVDIEAGRVTVRNATPTGDPRLDAALASLAGSGRPPKAERWVGHPRRKILDSYLEHLVAAGWLRREARVLTRWRIGDATRVADARARLDAIAMSAGRIDLTHAAFGGLAHAIGLENVLYPGWGNRGIRRRFREIADGQWIEPFAPEIPGNAADAAAAGGPDAAAHHSAVHAADRAASHAATHAATHATTQAAAHAATHAATQAATHAAMHAATHAAVQASVDAGHSAAAGGGHGGHGGH
jgi:hypothetical protein